MAGKTEEDDYWNVSDNKAYSFDDDDIPARSSFSNNNKLLTEDNVSEASYELPNSEIPLSLLISDQDLRMILEEQTMADSPLPKNLTLEEEVRLLRRHLLNRYHAPPAAVTITKLLIGKPVQLETYKSLNEKQELLDEAINSGNGDAILRVVLFLVKTLKKKFVNQMLQSRPEAVNHYVNYLTTRLQVTECTDLLTMLGRHHEAAMLQFHIAVTTSSNIDVRKQKLKKIYADFFSQPGAPQFYSQIIANYITLLEWQVAEKLKGTSNSGSLVDAPALETLRYACQHHKWTDSKSTDGYNPYHFIKQHQITAAQFEWVALNERAKSQAWRDLDGLFEKKTFIKTTFAIHIPLDKVIIQLHKLDAPVPVLNSFLVKVEDHQKRLILAKKVNAIRSVIDALAGLKDKQELTILKDSLEHGTSDRFYAENVLENLNSKWKADSIKIIKS